MGVLSPEMEKKLKATEKEKEKLKDASKQKVEDQQTKKGE